MNLLFIATLLLSGLCRLSSSVPRQYHVVKELKNWTEAQQYCRENFTDLATIDDMTEMEKLKSLIQEARPGNVWIGLQEKWQWSDGHFNRENEPEFRSWGNKQPNGQGPTGQFEDVNCVIQVGKSKRANERWNDYGCSEALPFICYDGGDSTHLYVLVKEMRNWTDAQRYCRENHTDLASVRNQSENKQINEVSLSQDVWIGLFRDDWEWSDGSSSSFRHWKSGEPNNKDIACTEIREDGLWYDVGCHHPINFACYEDNLVLVHENKTWKEALQYCTEHHADLVSVRSERTQLWVQRLAKGASTAHVWLGLRHTCGVGWFWVYGETLCYSNWAPGHEQVQDCTERVGAVKSKGGQEEGQWVSDQPETEKLNFICTTVDE